MTIDINQKIILLWDNLVRQTSWRGRRGRRMLPRVVGDKKFEMKSRNTCNGMRTVSHHVVKIAPYYTSYQCVLCFVDCACGKIGLHLFIFYLTHHQWTAVNRICSQTFMVRIVVTTHLRRNSDFNIHSTINHHCHPVYVHHHHRHNITSLQWPFSDLQ